MMKLNKFLSWCYKTANDKREFLVREKKSRLRQRALTIHIMDSEIAGTTCKIEAACPLILCD